MTNIFSNRFFQGGIAVAAVVIAFFGYQSFSDDTTDETTAGTEAAAEATTEVTTAPAETTENVDAIEDNVENAVNNAPASDTINSVTDESTTK